MMEASASFSVLVAEHGKWLMAFLRGMLGEMHDAEDAFQDLWLRFLRLKNPPRDSRALRSYLVKTARSVAIDMLRRRRPQISIDLAQEEGEAGPIEPADPSPTPEARFESKATAAEVRLAVSQLPLKWRQVVLMRIEGELEFREIAEELGVPIGTALTWMHNATVELKRRFGGEA